MSFFDDEPEPGMRGVLRRQGEEIKRALGEAPPVESADWPCRHFPGSVEPFPPRLVAFLYVLLRDGARAPGDVEQHGLNVRKADDGLIYTNPHLESYARSLAGYLLNQDEKPHTTKEDHMEYPTIGRIIIYRSRTGNYDVPAIINATQDTLYLPGVEGGYVPDLDSPEHVHLTVFTPGKPGLRSQDDFKVESDEPVSENVAGCYQEWNIPFGPQADPGTWRWPVRKVEPPAAPMPHEPVASEALPEEPPAPPAAEPPAPPTPEG